VHDDDDDDGGGDDDHDDDGYSVRCLRSLQRLSVDWTSWPPFIMICAQYHNLSVLLLSAV